MTDPSEIQTWILNKLKQVDSRLDSLEANSRNAASSDQPLVGPPSSSEDSRALARPEILAQLRSLVKVRYTERVTSGDEKLTNDELWSCFDEFLQMIDYLDQGPVAQGVATEGFVVDPQSTRIYDLLA